MDQEFEHDESVGVSVHAGFPNPGEDSRLGNLDLNQLLVKYPASTFLFEIDGGEWEDAGIFSGDVAVIDRALEIRKTDLVIWWQGSQLAISNFAKLPPAANVWGVVTAIIHRFRKDDR